MCSLPEFPQRVSGKEPGVRIANDRSIVKVKEFSHDFGFDERFDHQPVGSRMVLLRSQRVTLKGFVLHRFASTG